jgi:predicted transcriptional regulator
MSKKSEDGMVRHTPLLQYSNLTKDQLKSALETLKAEGLIIEEKRGKGLVYRLNEIHENSKTSTKASTDA